MENKASLRQQYKKLRATLSSAEREQASQTITNEVIGWLQEQVTSYKQLGFYLNKSEEVATAKLIDWALANNYEVFLPISNVENKNLTFLKVTAKWREEITENPVLKIWEPKPTNLKLKGSLDVIFMPLLVFDQKLNRIGWGKGYYDFYLSFAEKQPLKVGLAFQKQFSALPIKSEPHDQKLNLVFTEKAVYC
ncbi:5-formyltetrahydrofolate cyclo-ligase [Entomoplasma freundtii]|uniref:5-formyltetrahydrofolate cyclo-ligase n=1 Tax=Entomoplasma freundtii TaxID=74700 RepID=A0A2K8NRU3_9MOLU|nr:5-formyltetrahydrofolate cyclo-ligase [Entomoplasma freundtii]ATZ16529.1 5-formyltetrahydrofolate cyclo-ligase [Entomoplasma freundtii]TDY58305.1 5-formyltetrahydrofolate cyclo-ligase [Entomoplasma freundtii]